MRKVVRYHAHSVRRFVFFVPFTYRWYFARALVSPTASSSYDSDDSNFSINVIAPGPADLDGVFLELCLSRSSS